MSNLDELKKELRKFAQWYSSQEHKLLMSEYNYAYQEEKALKSISQYLEQETLKARIDELEQTEEYVVADYWDKSAGKRIEKAIELRIKELKGKVA